MVCEKVLTDSLPDYSATTSPSTIAVVAVSATRYAESVSTEDDAVRAFIASMIWGYGPIGYGAYRTERILHANPRHGERLLQVARLAREGDRTSAFAAAWRRETTRR